ncbi:hypothetical protein C8R44DRAFT_810954 [Mycena epipterygia]|nr:hypothetical protein C8R44DRAFT_810954 [Mycena epipterygia]
MSTRDGPSSTPDVAPREQCLQNSDLIGEILSHIASDPDDLQTQQQSLSWIASTCKDFHPTALRLLWRKLDNLLPLLYLLPSFTEVDGIYGLFGAIRPHEWKAFDRHAAFVKEIVYQNFPESIHIDPSVYVRLALRRSTILPNLGRLQSGYADPPASELLLYMQSPLQMIELGNQLLMPIWQNEQTISCLCSEPLHISSLILVNRPLGILSAGIPLQHLTSLKLHSTSGRMGAALLRQIGSLPHLHSFTAHTSCFNEASFSNIIIYPGAISGSEQIPGGDLFRELTHLELGGRSPGDWIIIWLFLQIVGTNHLCSLTIQTSAPPNRRVSIGRGGLGRGLRGGGPARTAMPEDTLSFVSRRWPTSLRRLELDGDYNYNVILKLLGRLPGLRSLSVSGILRVPVDVDLCSAFAGLANLEVLSFRCRSPADTSVPMNARDITTLAEICPKLHDLDIAISAAALPRLSSTPTLSHNLRIITIYSSDIPADCVAVGRHLDQLFPHLNTVRYTAREIERQKDWAEIQKLIFAFQDVRRTALLER